MVVKGGRLNFGISCIVRRMRFFTASPINPMQATVTRATKTGNLFWSITTVGVESDVTRLIKPVLQQIGLLPVA